MLDVCADLGELVNLFGGEFSLGLDRETERGFLPLVIEVSDLVGLDARLGCDDLFILSVIEIVVWFEVVMVIYVWMPEDRFDEEMLFVVGGWICG